MLVASPFLFAYHPLGSLAWLCHGPAIAPGIQCRPHPSPLLKHPSGFLLTTVSEGLSPLRDGHLPSFSARLLFARSKRRECARTCQTAAGETDGE